MKKSSTQPALDLSTVPKRVVLWVDAGGSNKVWVAERDGCTWKATWGKRDLEKRSQKVYETASEEKAAGAFLKAIAAKQAEGYRVGPSSQEAAGILEQRLSLVLDDRTGRLVVTQAAGPSAGVRVIDSDWFERGDVIRAIGRVVVFSVEELAIEVAPLPSGQGIYLDASREIGNGLSESTLVRVTAT